MKTTQDLFRVQDGVDTSDHRLMDACVTAAQEYMMGCEAIGSPPSTSPIVLELPTDKGYKGTAAIQFIDGCPTLLDVCLDDRKADQLINLGGPRTVRI